MMYLNVFGFWHHFSCGSTDEISITTAANDCYHMYYSSATSQIKHKENKLH